jgi:multidrug transporter EmrE-like cation transporter
MKLFSGMTRNDRFMVQQLSESWWLILASISAGVLGQLSLKLGVSQAEMSGATQGFQSLITMIFQSPLILLGLALYGVGALAWISVLSHLDLSYAYPFLALNFVLIALVSRFVLGETIPGMRWLGIAIICVGILVVARSTR